ncbi:hypothetical protein L596_022076 [Steinernema carpocapsae]|uniref:Uncharacterized protein n=1 Tax=Steinernema carpocapsae TaxID=34508 RepID=A0A4U5MKP0_STECR|nr:hypothetical protein L596_022076 [Steinernema carpocapsae]
MPTTIANSAYSTPILTPSRLQHRSVRGDGEKRANATATATETRTCSVRDIAYGKFRDERTDTSGSLSSGLNEKFD